MDAYSSIISNNLNQVIHRLTVITVVLMVPTLISSFLGMNVPNGLPEHPWAFYGVIVFSGLFTGVLYWFMQRRKFL
jgi:magnesium transporter